MAMYYYASKLSAVACGTRCRQGLARRQRTNRTNRQGGKKDDDEDSDDNSKDKKAPLSSFFCESTNDTIVISVKSSEQPEVCCESTPTLAHTQGSLGTGGVMYGNGTIVSGPLESLIDLLMPGNVEEFDQDYVFSFLLSARFFIRSYELLGKLLESIPEPEPLERIVPLLGVWTRMFPYDFRDERMMNHVKHIVARCADTKLANVVPQLLCALLARLTELENHEEELRSYQSTVDNKTESISWPTATQLAQLLCRIERNLAKHVGPEEFVQCSPNLLKDPNREDFTPKLASSGAAGGGSSGTGHATSLDGKKTCNLESYLEWSARLRLLVANEILKCRNIQDRNKQFELWSGAAQYCLLVGNYNSATAILESFDLPPVARLQVTWSKLSSTTSQQLDCMQRHAEGCGSLWSKQTEQHGNGNTDGRRSVLQPTLANGSPKPSTSASSATVSTGSGVTRSTSNEWVVIPVFVDIIKLALKAREDCCVRLPNGHINMTAFDRLAAIVGAFTRHMIQVNQTLPDVGQYATLCQFMQSCKLLNETELMLASFECEAPTPAEKELYDVA
ncbi:ras-GEF domain-containing family member 1B-like [Anopheles stephensi]|uniref:ras-GEF domain-containing family member 1B-like n=1 Tax=Anopheles stephensi TaxID=30069 RepID=UPI001658B349|nr:ras-GEF domain-containing family member 1B-like [Anopheles stephensi]XP_035911014.1 ras-GEF domain-containing family member 1B-like [Anopheles stephensi]XP_035911015.1 ras-GEF domain-containing family member 1B-like [Anopheles stephensi]XP_035911016.1 ras-GEF domain-containing family member 1B-like [Anopheles stephensi]